MSSCAASLAYWDHFTENQGSHTFFEDMAVMAHVPSYPATLGGPTRLTTRPGPHSLIRHGPDNDEAEAFRMPHMILGVGFEQPL
jgi:hypothetical protein